jgi:hypothetical protein
LDFNRRLFSVYAELNLALNWRFSSSLVSTICQFRLPGVFGNALNETHPGSDRFVIFLTPIKFSINSLNRKHGQA